MRSLGSVQSFYAIRKQIVFALFPDETGTPNNGPILTPEPLGEKVQLLVANTSKIIT